MWYLSYIFKDISDLPGKEDILYKAKGKNIID